MDEQNQSGFQTDRVPAQCRSGPLSQRSCTDLYCCILYMLLLAAVITFGIMCAQGIKFTQAEIENKLSRSELGKPLLAISKATLPIILALGCVMALGLILMVTTFILPEIVIYLYIPVILVLMGLMGGAFIYRYFGNDFPFINAETQDKYVKGNSVMALGVGLLFLVGFVVTIVTICCKKQKFRNMIPVLKMARICFWENCYVFFLAVFLSILSIVLIYANIILLQISQNDKSGQHIVNAKVLAALILVQMLFTHGFIQSLSDFLFQAIAINWYFNSKKLGDGYSRCGNNFSSSIGLAVRHIGTIAWGSIYAYIPDFLNSWIGTCQRGTPRLYAVCCCLHKCSCRKISRYSHSMTILQNFGFFEANSKMFSLKQRTKSILPQIYMMGNFYSTIVKILLTMVGLIICYILMLQINAGLYSKILNIIPPLIVIILASSQIGTHFTNCAGLFGDTLSFMYNVDLEIQKVHFGQLEPTSCHPEIRAIVQGVKLGQRLYQN